MRAENGTRGERIADAMERLAQERANLDVADYAARWELLLEARTEPAAPDDALIREALEGLIQRGSQTFA